LLVGGESEWGPLVWARKWSALSVCSLYRGPKYSQSDFCHVRHDLCDDHAAISDVSPSITIQPVKFSPTQPTERRVMTQGPSDFVSRRFSQAEVMRGARVGDSGGQRGPRVFPPTVV
jgi:hypothetical protein